MLKAPNGTTQVVIHGTPSDVNWFKAAIRPDAPWRVRVATTGGLSNGMGGLLRSSG
jgi:hypothetical protein